MYFLTSRDLKYQYSSAGSNGPGEFEAWGVWSHNKTGLSCKLKLSRDLVIIVDAPYFYNHLCFISSDNIKVFPSASQFCVIPHCFIPYQLTFFIYAPCPALQDTSTYPQVIAALFELGVIDKVRLGEIDARHYLT